MRTPVGTEISEETSSGDDSRLTDCRGKSRGQKGDGRWWKYRGRMLGSRSGNSGKGLWRWRKSANDHLVVPLIRQERSLLMANRLQRKIIKISQSSRVSQPARKGREENLRLKAKCRAKKLRCHKTTQGYVPPQSGNSGQVTEDRSHRGNQDTCFPEYSSGWLTAPDEYVYAVTWPP
jgi:hypothetical protein